MKGFAKDTYAVVTNNYTHYVYTTDKGAAEDAVFALELASGIRFTKIEKIMVEIRDKWVEC